MELERVIRAIRESYYIGDGKEISTEDLVDAALAGIVGSLDRDSMLVTTRPSSLEFIRGLEEEGSVADTRLLGRDVGYIRIKFFGRRTGTDFRKALGDLKNMKGLIIDLRDNPGGILQSALDVLGSFIPRGRLLLTEVRKGEEKQYFSQAVTAPGVSPETPIAVLINARTASSAEIVAATLSHYRDALIVGSRSRAKGTIQEIIPLSSKKTLVLTTGEYVLADGSSLREAGVAPDYAVEDEEAQLEVAMSLLRGNR